MLRLCTLIILILTIEINAGGVLFDQFCNLKLNTTGQIRTVLKKSQVTRQVRDVIKRAQYFNYDNKTVRFIIYQRGEKIFVDELKSDLSIIQHTDKNESQVNFIDSLDEYILAREFSNQGNTINYVVYKIQPGGNGTLLKTTIDGATDFDQNQMIFANVSKIIQIENSLMYVVVQFPAVFQNPRGAVYTINLKTNQKMKFFANLTQSFSVNIIGGNKQVLYNANCGIFHVLDKGTQKYIPKTLEDLGLSQYLTSTVSFMPFSFGVSMAYSTINQITNIILIDNKMQISKTAVQIEGKLDFESDRYKNAIFSTQKDFVWFRVQNGTATHFQLSKSNLSSSQKQNLLDIFGNMDIALFEFQLATVQYLEPTDITFTSFALVKFNTTSRQVTVEDQYPRMLDGRQNQLRFFPSEIWTNQLGFSCLCISNVLLRIECSATNFKCRAITFPKRQNCTKPIVKSSS